MKILEHLRQRWKGKVVPDWLQDKVGKEENNNSRTCGLCSAPGIFHEPILHILILTGGLLWMAFIGAEEKLGTDCLNVRDYCLLLKVCWEQLAQG